MRTNAERAEHIGKVMRKKYDLHPEGVGPREAVADVLADLRHFCDANGVDFADADKTARNNYSAEVWEERSGRV